LNKESNDTGSTHYFLQSESTSQHRQPRLGLQSDVALSRRLKIARHVIGNIRAGRLQIGGSMLLWMHEATGISIDELRRLMGDRRAKCRPNVRLPIPRGDATN